MTTTVVTLDAVAQSYGKNLDAVLGGTDIYDDPVLVGGGSISDGSDSSYVQIGTWSTTDLTDHVEPLSVDFVLPPPYTNPTAIALKVRMRNDPDALDPGPPDFYPSNFWLMIDAVSDDTHFGDRLWTAYRSFSFANGVAASIDDYSFWWDDVDLDDPTDAGNWFEFAVDAFTGGADTALTSDGLRITMAVEATVAMDIPPHRRPWLNVFEFQLLVACTTGLSLAPPCQLYPRDDDQGAGNAAIWPPPSSSRPGSYY